jgi:hypothetical protein
MAAPVDTAILRGQQNMGKLNRSGQFDIFFASPGGELRPETGAAVAAQLNCGTLSGSVGAGTKSVAKGHHLQSGHSGAFKCQK